MSPFDKPMQGQTMAQGPDSALMRSSEVEEIILTENQS